AGGLVRGEWLGLRPPTNKAPPIRTRPCLPNASNVRGRQQRQQDRGPGFVSGPAGVAGGRFGLAAARAAGFDAAGLSVAGLGGSAGCPAGLAGSAGSGVPGDWPSSLSGFLSSSTWVGPRGRRGPVAGHQPERRGIVPPAPLAARRRN